MSGYEYEIRKGSAVSRWMCSPVKKESYRSCMGVYPPSCYTGVPWQEVISPVRRQFLEEKPFENGEEELPECGSLYYPFETERVEFDAFYKLPMQLTFGAALGIRAPKEGVYPFRLTTCGGVKVFVNGEKQESFFPYRRNEECEKELLLRMREGENVLYVLANELAERDTRFSFRLHYEGGETLKGILPVSVKPERLERIRGLLSGIYLKQFRFENRKIEVFFGNPVEESLSADVRLEFRDSHTPPFGLEKKVLLEERMEKLSVGDLIPGKTGLAFLTIRTEAEGIRMERTLNFEYYEEKAMPREGPGTIAERKREALAFAAENGLGNLPKLLALRETGQRTGSETEEEIRAREFGCIRRREDCADFRLPALFYLLSSDRFTGEEKEEAKQLLLNFRYWFDEPGNDVMWFFSENHALLFHAAEYLAGGRFPEEIFQNSGMRGEDHRKKGRRLLLEWFERFFRNGFQEWNSPVYIPIDVMGFFVLYDFAPEEDMRRLAERALDKAFSVFATNSWHGIMAAGCARIYFKNLIGRRIGEAAALNYMASGEGYLNQHVFCAVAFALSGYEPPPEVLRLYEIPEEGRVSESVEDGARLYNYRTPDYMLAGVLNYRPGEPGGQEHVMQLMIGDCDTQIWINHPGEARYFGEGRPGYFAGNGTLPEVRQDKNRMVMSFHLLDQEVDYTHAFCPLERFEEYVEKGKWIFLKKSPIFTAIYAENGIAVTRDGPLKDYELISLGKDNTWKILVEKETGHMDFKSFINSIP